MTTAALDDPESVHVLFAGGIHDALSAAVLSVLAAPLVARGMKVGVVMGTAYLFTEEIVRTGAIVKEFQSQAIACQATTLLQSGVGIYTRCAQTPFCDEFNRTRRELILAMEPEESILKLLELLNIGRLRIASKGIAHNSQTQAEYGSERYLKIDTQTQRREGMYMLGEVARLRNKSVSIAELHAEISLGSGAILARDAARPTSKRAIQRQNHDDIAVIGMACLLPQAADLRRYWQNIVQRVNAAFHSPAMRSARDLLAAELGKLEFKAPQIPVFSNTTARRYPETSDEVRALLARHLTEPVRFVEEIQQLYEDGARIFTRSALVWS